MERFSVKLLFQFRVEVDGRADRFRTCEERIICFKARSARAALAQARSRGKKAEFDYICTTGAKVKFQFVGVLDMTELSSICGPDEVWYDISRRLLPMERKSKIIPTDEKLLERT